MAAESFRILFVCTGNVARSPVAESCARECAGSVGGLWELSSVGTHAVDGDPMRADARAAADRAGHKVLEHSSRRISAEDCLKADLILTMEWEQVAHVWSMVPDAWGKCFTLKEFVYYARKASTRPAILFASEAEMMRDRIRQAHELRRRARSDLGFWGGLRPQDLDLPEPEGHADGVWDAFVQAVKLLVSDTFSLLGARSDVLRLQPVQTRGARSDKRAKTAK